MSNETPFRPRKDWISSLHESVSMFTAFQSLAAFSTFSLSDDSLESDSESLFSWLFSLSVSSF